MPRRPKEKIDIDVVPYLSIMVIVLKLICLILIVTVMRIALNPHGVKAVSIENLYGVERKEKGGAIKAPTYFDCSPKGIAIHPGGLTVTVNELAYDDNPVVTTIKEISENSAGQYAIVLVRPGAVKEFRHVRQLLYEYNVEIGYDVFDSDTEVNYKKAAHAAGINM